MRGVLRVQPNGSQDMRSVRGSEGLKSGGSRCRAACGLIPAVICLLVGSIWGAEGDVVSIRREPLQLIPAQKFHVDLSLQPQRLQTINASTNGQILQVQVAPGEVVAVQRDCVRLDDTRQKEVVRRAAAFMEVARIELKMAGDKGDKDQEGLAKARMEVAEAESKLASLDLEALTCRSPFAGLVVKQHVYPGQYVRLGDPLLTLADVKQLTAEVPVDRTATKVGQEIELTADQTVVKGKVTALLPPTDAIAPLREIIPSLATAVVAVENGDGKLAPGQAIYSPLVPQETVTLVKAEVVTAHTEGRRKVQVLRNGVVRDVVVEALGQKGTDQVYIAGAFGSADEIVMSSTLPLKDGQKLSPAEAPPASPKGTGSSPPAGSSPPTSTTTPTKSPPAKPGTGL